MSLSVTFTMATGEKSALSACDFLFFFFFRLILSLQSRYPVIYYFFFFFFFVAGLFLLNSEVSTVSLSQRDWIHSSHEWRSDMQMFINVNYSVLSLIVYDYAGIACARTASAKSDAVWLSRLYRYCALWRHSSTRTFATSNQIRPLFTCFHLCASVVTTQVRDKVKVIWGLKEIWRLAWTAALWPFVTLQ